MSGLSDMNRFVRFSIAPFQLDDVAQAGHGAAENVEGGTEITDAARREDADAWKCRFQSEERRGRRRVRTG